MTTIGVPPTIFENIFGGGSDWGRGGWAAFEFFWAEFFPKVEDRRTTNFRDGHAKRELNAKAARTAKGERRKGEAGSLETERRERRAAGSSWDALPRLGKAL